MRTNDVDRTPRHYHQAGVEQYVVIDQERENGPRRLIDNRWTPDGYVQEPPDANGRILVPSLGLLLGIRDNRVYVLDAGTGDEIGEHAKEHADRVQAQRRADDEKRRADDEKRRADDEKGRADDEKGRADNEKRRADEAEAELARLRKAVGKS